MRRGRAVRGYEPDDARRRFIRRRQRSGLELVAAVLSVAVLAGAWAAVGYAVGRWPGAAIGAVAGSAAAALLWWLISRLRIG